MIVPGSVNSLLLAADQYLPGSQEFGPGTYSFTVPDGVYSIQATLIAGGGGGGSGSGDVGGIGGRNYEAGAGGGSAPVVRGTIAVVPGDILSLVVGAGGAAGNGYGSNPSNSTGGSGSTSWIGKWNTFFLQCTGGTGGQAGGWGAVTPGAAGMYAFNIAGAILLGAGQAASGQTGAASYYGVGGYGAGGNGGPAGGWAIPGNAGSPGHAWLVW